MNKKIAHFEIIGKLGAGGMGEVFRARDTVLNREVALKIVPPAYSKDSQRMLRFEREAQLLASLNHPNIAQIYGLEETDDDRTLVLELVEGQTLEEKISSGPLDVRETAKIALQMAEAIEYAHEQGVVHRDLKPANIKLTPDGKVKILDFGLAKALEAERSSDDDPSLSPTLTMAATQAGVIMGTAGYMSPEQAAGQSVDRRSDIWAYGVILFEMLTGRQLFTGDTISHTLASVLRDEPGWDTLPSHTPKSMVQLIRRCLERDPTRRLQAIGEARISIGDFLAGKETEEAVEVASSVPARSRLTNLARWALAFLATAFLGAALIVYIVSLFPAEIVPLRKLELPIEDLRISNRMLPAISPSGQRVVYRAGESLRLRDLTEYEDRELPGTDEGLLPFWSPDSSALGYVKDNRILRMSIAGGQSTLIAESPEPIAAGGGCVWHPDGNVYFMSGNSGIYRVPVVGGDPVLILEPDPEVELDFHFPSLLPDGRGVLAVVHRKELDDTLFVFDGEQRKDIFRLEGTGLGSPFYSPSGHILFVRQDSSPGIWAVRFSLGSLEVQGHPFLVIGGGRYLSISSEGSLLAFRGASEEETQLAWTDAQGKLGGTYGRPQTEQLLPRFSPDGGRIGVSAGRVEDYSVSIWVHDLARETANRLLHDGINAFGVHWFPDGEQIIYTGFKSGAPVGVFKRKADGSDEPEAVLADEAFATDISSDGRYLLYDVLKKESPAMREVRFLDLKDPEGSGMVFAIEESRLSSRTTGAVLSPNGTLLAYQSGESGISQVYLTAFPSGSGRWQVSVNGGSNPRWAVDGKELVFRNEGQLFRILVNVGQTVRLGNPELVVSSKEIGLDPSMGYDISADGQRFLFVRTGESAMLSLTLVQNWFREFQQ